MIKLYEIHGGGNRTEIASFGYYFEAKRYVQENYNIAIFERDEDNVDCADFLTHSGGQYAIQPETQP